MELMSPARSRHASRHASPTAHALADATSSSKDKQRHIHANQEHGQVQQHTQGTHASGHTKQDASGLPLVSGSEVPSGELLRLQQQRLQPSYATSAYREFLQSAGNSRTSSRRTSASVSGTDRDRDSGFGFGSAQSSALSSAYSSVASSVAPSGTNTQYASRATSPRLQEVDHTTRDSNHTQADAGAHSAGDVGQSAPSQMVHLLRGPTIPGQGQLSLASLKPSLPDDLDEGPLQTEVPVRTAPRPRHFTFDQRDVLKSFKRAEERERIRAEQEARVAQNAAVQAAREQERSIQLMQHQREQAARDAAYKLSLQRQELDRRRRFVSHTDSSTSSDLSDSDDATASSGDSPAEVVSRVHSPLPPSHFKFDSHDLRKSFAKPSQRQQIGHWSTFPRSSTVMYPAQQLKAMLQHRQQEDEGKLHSAPSSPRHHMVTADANGTHASVYQAARHQMGEAYGTRATHDMHRRLSMPAQVNSSSNSSILAPAAAAQSSFAFAPRQHTLPAPHLLPLESRPAVPLHPAQPQPQTRASQQQQRTRPSHSRSVTLGSLPADTLARHAASFGKDAAAQPSASASAYHKHYPRAGSAGRGSSLESGTRGGGARTQGRVLSAGAVERRTHLADGAAAKAGAWQAVEGRLAARQQSTDTRRLHRAQTNQSSYADLAATGLHASRSEPTSPRQQHQSSARAHLQDNRDHAQPHLLARGASMSTHPHSSVHPSLHSAQSLSSVAPQLHSSGVSAQQAPRPHASLHVGESKHSGSANSSPHMSSRSRSMADYQNAMRQQQHEGRGGDVNGWGAAPTHSHHVAAPARGGLYRDVPSSGYGQRR